MVHTTSASTVFILAGSGTFGWDQVGANLIEKDDRALVLHTGYFGDGFRECLDAYGASVDLVKSELGGTVKITDVENALKNAKDAGKPYKVVTITHVDTSTGVLSDARAVAACVRRFSPDTLVCFFTAVMCPDWNIFLFLFLIISSGGPGRGLLSRIGGCTGGRLGSGCRAFGKPERVRCSTGAEYPGCQSASDRSVGGKSEARGQKRLILFQLGKVCPLQYI